MKVFVMFKAGTVILSSVAALGLAACMHTAEGVKEDTSRAAATTERAVDDSMITGKVKAALVADDTTKAHQINVETYKGTVQLSGFVDSAEARARAAELARNVDGVKQVKNSLALRTASR